MQRMKKPGGRDLASSEFVLLDGARTLRVPKMPKNDYITEAPRQALFVCDPEVLGRAGEHLAAVGGDQAAIAEAREAIRRGLVTLTAAGEAAALELADSVFSEKRLVQRRAESWTNRWPEFLVDVAKFSGVDAVLANEGAFMIDERVYVCHEDELQRGLETGWNCVRLASIDGRARREHLRAPCVLVSPDESCFIWQPMGDLRKQRLVSFFELCELLGEMGARLAAARGLLEVAA